MNIAIDSEYLLASIPGDSPSGEDLRYTQVYDDIKEARRADDALDMGDWQRDIKTSDWDKVIRLSLEALGSKSKDLQIAVWLTEALSMRFGFGGLGKGMAIINGFLERFWDTLYPEMDGEDLDYRIAPLEFLNDKLSSSISLVPLTEPGTTPGYSLLKWKESREVGSEADTKNKYGDTDNKKKERRDELLAEGKISAEEFDVSVARSSGAFYKKLVADLSLCRQAFNALDNVVDGKFGNDAPRLSDFGETLGECERLVSRICGDQGKLDDDNAEPVAEPASAPAEKKEAILTVPDSAGTSEKPMVREQFVVRDRTLPLPLVSGDVALQEEKIWEEALNGLENGGFRSALDRLLSICNSQPSERGRSRYSLLVAKLCLKAGRPDLARPIMEQLNTRITELQLEKWESPLWIAEVLDALYQCLVSGEPSDDDMARAGELFRKICTFNVTQVLDYRK
jgi:type VI secretion system protein ImpA